jgi:predicted N-acetyltransferase YhbS
VSSGSCQESLGKQAADFGSTELEKEAWVSEVLLEWGSCGRVVHMDGVPAGYVIYAPPSAVPRAAEMPTGPVSADAVLLTTMQVMPEFAGEGLGRMLAQAVVKDLTRRGSRRSRCSGSSSPAPSPVA